VKRFLPKIADNNFHGPKIALYFFIFFMAVNTARSLIHFLAEDAGLNTIANIIIFEGNPDPNNVIYLFGSLWGEMQLLCCLISWIVIIRYKSLIPLMYFVWLMEWILRETIVKYQHGLDLIYKTGPTPGSDYAPLVIGLLLIFFIMSLRDRAE
jgi:hypothetical protein